MRTSTNRKRQAVILATALAALTTLCGCDYGLGSLITGLNELANSSGLGGFGGGSYYPDYGLYDPTDLIQSTVQYRQDVYDRVNEGWSDYIRQ